MNRVIPTLIDLYSKLPFRPFKSGVKKIWNVYLSINRHRTVIATVDGITYELCLGERIDSSIYYKGYFERDTTITINNLCRKAMTVLDIGANIGCHTFRFAKLVGAEGKVIAFEPTLCAFTKLKRNMELNNFDNVILEKIALSNESKNNQTTYFYSSWPLRVNDNTQAHPIHGGCAMKDVVDFVTLDDYVQEKEIKKIDFIKLDVDGYEFKVIQGAIETLKLHKPLIIMELNAYTLEEVGDNIVDLVSLLSSLGYKFYSEKDLNMFPSVDILIDSIPKGGGINVILSANNL